MTTTTKTDKITAIATICLGIETLESRGSDSLDFHAVSVWQIKDALESAYNAGMVAASRKAVQA